MFHGFQIRKGRANTHIVFPHAVVSTTHPTSDGLITVLFSLVCRHHQEEGRAIVPARCVAGSGNAVLVNSPQLGQALYSGAGTRKFIFIYHSLRGLFGRWDGDWDDFIASDSFLISLCQPLLASEGKLVRLGTGNIPFNCHLVADGYRCSARD